MKTLGGLVFVESARYLFGGVWRLGEYGLPVRPNKHYEREVEEDQVDNWNKNWTTRQIIYTEPMMDKVSAQKWFLQLYCSAWCKLWFPVY